MWLGISGTQMESASGPSLGAQANGQKRSRQTHFREAWTEVTFRWRRLRARVPASTCRSTGRRPRAMVLSPSRGLPDAAQKGEAEPAPMTLRQPDQKTRRCEHGGLLSAFLDHKTRFCERILPMNHRILFTPSRFMVTRGRFGPLLFTMSRFLVTAQRSPITAGTE